MISRRNFLKIAGLSTVALGAGFTTGKLTEKSKSVYYSVHGFIPDDAQIIKNILTSFRTKTKSSSGSVIFAESGIKKIIAVLDEQSIKSGYSSKGKIIYRINRVNNKVGSDIIVSDDKNSIYSLDDLNLAFSGIRESLRNRVADYYFTAEYSETDFFSSLFNTNKKEVVIENENGLVDRIFLDKNYKNIFIDGPMGKTGLKIENGIVRVHTSTCKHGICKHSIANNAGNIIACAPNKVLVRIV